MDTQGEANPAAHRNSTVMGNNNQNCNNVTASYNTYNGCQLSVSDERGQVVQWLSPLAPKERHRVISVDRVDGVGDWLLQTDGFVGWRGSETQAVNRVLFCCGNPGTGKTYLRHNCEDNGVVACMYCDFHAPGEQPAAGVLAALLKQVVAGLEPILGEIQNVFERANRQVDGRALWLPEIRTMLIKSISSLRQVFICIDALDGFPSKHRPGLWKSLQHIVLECPNTRLFVTGRPHIQGEVREYFNTGAVTVPASLRQEDIGRYLKRRLEIDQYPDAMDKELQAEILKIIPERISKIGRSQMLHDMTKGLNLQSAYSATLARMEEQKGDQAKLGMRALMWISRSHQPLKVEELCHALAVEVGAAYFDLHRVPTPRTLRACTLRLVAIDQQTSTARLMHFTLREYLEGHLNLLTTAHSMIAETCLTYLNTLSVRKLTEIHDDTVLAKPFLENASCH
ncbi:hypothetical protein L873DRAFT_1788696 [Choiromyces venosus 120613-1]|uniref:NACHT domain-containing protein n=1 Tax=Choiromyces venosus 120613-1 TaxID=1336337 RepID=A0A3N4JQZ3_9PEZI|nr:hypothetical protein L873DRAFT_1788696 [Choiromyces venosus 120613-1]